MSSAEKDALLRGWERIDSAAIVKDVATKGKYINLAIAFLAKRMNSSVDQAKSYFRTEVDAYVRRLLSNGQVFRAEHLLKNLNRTSKYVFYEFLVGLAEAQPAADDAQPNGSSCAQIIVKYLAKDEDNFEALRGEFDIVLKMLTAVADDRQLREKYAARLEKFSLEEIYKEDEVIRDAMAADVFFIGKHTFVVPRLRKEQVWTYLLEHKHFGWIIKWINILGSDEDVGGSRDSQFDVDLCVMFRHWEITADMLEELGRLEVSDAIRDSLARHGMFLSDERDQMNIVLERVFTTESWIQNSNQLESGAMKRYVADHVLEHGLQLILMQDVCKTNDLNEAQGSYPNETQNVSLSLALRSIKINQWYEASTEVSKYMLQHDPDFYHKNPLIYLSELILKNTSNADGITSINEDPILARIPYVQSLLTKCVNSATTTDHTVTLFDMAKRFLQIDLGQMQQEAGAELLNFSNPILIAKYGSPEKLGFLYYVKQCRSAFAVFVFAIEQLRQFSQISKGQIMYACSLVTNIALEKLDNTDLVTHCMAFIEMLGIDSSAIRARLQCVSLVLASKPGFKLNEMGEEEFRQEVIQAVSCDPIVNNLDMLRMVSDAAGKEIPNALVKRTFVGSGWFRSMAMASYLEYSLHRVIAVLTEGNIDEISSNVADNLVLALRYECAPDRRRRNGNAIRRRNVKQDMVTSGETMSSSISSTENMSNTKLIPSKFLDDKTDLLATILQCTPPPSASASSSSTSYEEEKFDLAKLLELFCIPHSNSSTIDNSSTTALNLLRRSMAMKWPILTVLSATLNPEHLDFCWFIWLALSTSVPAPKEATDFKEIALELIQYSATNGYVTTLHQSFQIFYPESSFRLFTEYLHETKNLNFTDHVSDILRSYLEAIDPNSSTVEIQWLPQSEMLKLSASLLVHHLKYNVDSVEHRQYLLHSLCQSGIGDIVHVVDFCTLERINSIISFTEIDLNVDLFVRDRYTDNQIRAEYGRICDSLVNQQHFNKAMRLAEWLGFPKDNIIYESWVWEWETNASAFDLGQCERDMVTFSLAPELVINFYTLVADKLQFGDPHKYRVLKRILDVIKKHNLFPNESFDCDRIEYDMVLSYLRNGQTIDELDVFYSDYFESIMAKERFVLYKSFAELKEISGLDDLTVCNKRPLSTQEEQKLNDLIYKLLDDGDIVQALRLQAIFLHRPVDLHYLVFCMAIAEGLASLNDLTPEQEQLNRDANKFAASRFNRRTLRPNRVSQCSASSSPVKPNYLDTSDNSVVLEFEEIPSRQKQDILNALQNFAARITHGSKIAQRIMMTWRAAMYLDKDYVDVLKTKDAYLLLESATSEDCLYKLDVMNDIMSSMALTKQECADFLADKIAEAIIQSKFYIIQQNHHQPHLNQPQDTQNLWGYDLDKQFRLFLELCPSTAALGNRLLKHCDAIKVYRKIDPAKKPSPERKEESAIQEIVSHLQVILDQKVLSHKKQNTICVELLIKAHECFVHECYMEGIAWVLHRTKIMNQVLSSAKSWSLIVKMLMGIGRYREMYYCFETLIKNDQFESLLGKFDHDRIGGLNQAIISYLREHCPESTEYYRLTALHFRMYKEIAQMWESEARAVVASVLADTQFRMDENGLVIPSFKNTPVDETVPNLAAFHLRCSPVLATKLNVAMEGYAHAAENYLIDNKLAMAQTTASLAELVALQIHLVRKAVETSGSGGTNGSPSQNPTEPLSCHCVCVVNIVSASMMKFVVNNFLSVPQALILSRAYPFEINWTEALYTQYIQRDNEPYLHEFCDRIELTEPMIEVLVKTFQHQAAVTPKMEANIGRLVEMVESVTLRYRLSSLLGLKRCIAGLINDHSLYYLKDTNYGRNETLDNK